MNIPAYISDLLFHNECVILPGFGGFLSSYKSASIHPTLHEFSPPSKSISFNKRLTNNDGLLINHIAKKEGITYDAASREIEAFVTKTKRSIVDRNMVNFPKIGKLVLDVEDNLQFSPDNSSNYLKDAFGLSSFQSKPVQRAVREDHRRITATVPVVAPEKNTPAGKHNFLKVAMVLSIVALAALANMLIFDVYIDQLSLNEAKVFDLIFNNGHTPSSPMKDVEPIRHPEEHYLSDMGAIKENMEIDIVPGNAFTLNSPPFGSAAKPRREGKTSNKALVDAEENEAGKGYRKAAASPTIAAKGKDVSRKEDLKTKDPTKMEENVSGKNTAGNTMNARDGYYIILGSFKDPENARKMKREMDETYTNTIISRNKWGFDRVGYFVSTRKSEAQNELNFVKQTKPEAWIIRHSADQSAGQ